MFFETLGFTTHSHSCQNSTHSFSLLQVSHDKKDGTTANPSAVRRFHEVVLWPQAGRVFVHDDFEIMDETNGVVEDWKKFAKLAFSLHCVIRVFNRAARLTSLKSVPKL